MVDRISKLIGLFALDIAIAISIIGGIIVAFHVLPSFAHDFFYVMVATVAALVLKVIGMLIRNELAIITSAYWTKRKLKKEFKR